MQRTFTLPPMLLRRLARIAAKERVAPVELVTVAVTELVAAYGDARQSNAQRLDVERERESTRTVPPTQPNGIPVHPDVDVRNAMTNLEVVWNGTVDRERSARRRP
jgi:hypothetical protein